MCTLILVCTYIGSDPHIYEEPNPSSSEPIYEQVGRDAKVIPIEANEAYISHDDGHKCSI